MTRVEPDRQTVSRGGSADHPDGEQGWTRSLADRLVPLRDSAVQCRAGGTDVHFVEHGEGVPVLVLHGAFVDHREVEACFEPALSAYGGLRRLYPDLPGMGRTAAPATVRSADAVLDVLLGFVDAVAGGQPLLLLGHSAGAYYAQGIAGRRPDRVVGLALVCPLLAGVRDVPGHEPVIAANLGGEQFRDYFVVQTPAMLERYERFVAPGAELADTAALARIGEQWELTAPGAAAYAGPVLVVAGRQDSTVGYAAAVELVEGHPRSTLAVLDRAGHALPHEQPELLGALLRDWLLRTGAGG